MDVAAPPGVPVGVPPLGVGQRQPAGEPGDFAVLVRPDDQVPVIGHDAVGQQPCLRAIDSLFQDKLKRLIVPVFREDGYPGVRAIQHVVDQAAFVRSFWPSHGAKGTE